jgi:putative acetyltransferase
MRSMNVQGRLHIRPLEAVDVPAILQIISKCRREYGLEGRVHAILEPADFAIHDLYRRPRASYFVAIVGGEVAGGAEIALLADEHQPICTLQRMYLRRSNRGVGIGRMLLAANIQAAQRFGFERCYAETISEMTTAVAFYQRNGFRLLTTPFGNTGHTHSDRWMMLDLTLPKSSAGLDHV